MILSYLIPMMAIDACGGCLTMTIMLRGSLLMLYYFVPYRDTDAIESPTAIINLSRSARAVRQLGIYRISVCICISTFHQ